MARSLKSWLEAWAGRGIWVPLLRLRFGGPKVKRGVKKKIYVKKYPPKQEQ